MGNPDAVLVERRIDEKGVLLELTVDPDDLGRVIGKRGATAQSLRTLLRALGTKNDARYNLKIVDNGVGGADDGAGSRQAQSDDDVATSADNSSSVNTDHSDGDIIADTDSERSDSDEKLGKPSSQQDDNSRVSKTRRELQELDDLDV